MARCPFAVWRGPIVNMKPGGMIHPVRGLVLHVEEGTEEGTSSWFHNPKAQASAHFGIAKDGTLHQWVDTDDRAWAEAAGNAYWWSVETEGTHTEPLTDSQIAALARLYGWLAALPDKIPTVLAETVNDRGFGWHGMGGVLWGGHLNCPGDLRRGQRADVLARIVRPAPSPTVPLEEDPMFIVWHANDAYLLCQGRLSYIAGPDDLKAFAARGAVELGPLTDGEFGVLCRAYGVDGKPVV